MKGRQKSPDEPDAEDDHEESKPFLKKRSSLDIK